MSQCGLGAAGLRTARFDDLDSLRLGATGSQYRVLADDEYDPAADSVM